MQPLENQQLRINLTELKSQLVKKLGPERSKRYFYYLNRLFSQKVSKGEFDKICVRTIGRENLPLHNQLIRSILKNTCHSKVPPPVHEKEAPSKLAVSVGKCSPLGEKNGYQQSGSLLNSAPGPTPLVWSNGDLPTSPRKSRSGVRDRRPRDRLSPLGPNGKTELISHSSAAPDDNSVKAVTENGDVNLCDFRRPVHHHHQGLAEHPGNEQDALLQRPTKRPRTKKSPDDPVSTHSKGQSEAVVFEDGEEVQQGGNTIPARSPLCAPLGIPFCSASVGGTHRALPSFNNSGFLASSDIGALFDSETLRKRMEQIVGAQGLEGVSLDCVNLLNNGLDVYLKRLIRSCVELVGSRSGHESLRQRMYKQQPPGKLMNGIWPSHQLQMQSGGVPMDSIQERRTGYSISMLDFKVAMELNPQQLGEDWPLLLEKICMHTCEE